MGRRRGALILGAGLALLSLAVPARVPEPYPGGEVYSESGPVAGRHRVMLGSLKKIRNVLEPEASTTVSGRREVVTWYFPDERSVDALRQYYREQLASFADIVFACEGRDCGSSNYWANTVFDNAILYGPEQYQTYLVATDTETGDYVSVYIGERGTRKVYVQVEHIALTRDAEHELGKEIHAALESAGRYTFHVDDGDATALSRGDSLAGTSPPVRETGREAAREVPRPVVPDSVARAIVDAMAMLPRQHLVVVGHVVLEPGESIDDAIVRSAHLAEGAAGTLSAAGLERSRIETYGVGPLAADGTRLDFVVRDRLARAPGTPR